MAFKTEFRYELNVPFPYTSNGIAKTANILKVKAPKTPLSPYTSMLENIFGEALFNIQKNFSDLEEKAEKEKEKKDKNLTEEQKLKNGIDSIVSVINQSSKYSEAYPALKKILTYDVGDYGCLVIDSNDPNSEDPFMASFFDVMDYRDTRNLLAAYIVNFLNTSLTD